MSTEDALIACRNRVEELERQLSDTDGHLRAALKQRDHWQNAARSLERDYTALVAKYRTMQWVIRTQARLPDEENLAPRALGVMASVEVKDE